MNRKKIVSGVLILLTGAVLSLSISCLRQGSGDLEVDGDAIVKRIEEFQKKKGRLPNSLNEIGIEEKLEGPIYYRKLDDKRYQLWYGTQLGESVTYDSDSRRWE